MKCSCGKRCDLLNTRLMVDEIHKEYICLPCGSRILEIKDKFENFTVKEVNGLTQKTTQWNTRGTK